MNEKPFKLENLESPPPELNVNVVLVPAVSGVLVLKSALGAAPGLGV